MSETCTPGQIAHDVYWRTLDGLPPLLAWGQLMSDDRAAWEAAAQAAITAWIASPDWPTPPPEDTP